MNTLIAGLITAVGLAISLPATAQHRHGQLHGPQFRHHVPSVIHHHHYRMQRHWHPNHGWVWVVPSVIGGAIVYDIWRNQNSRPVPTITEEVISPGLAPVAPTNLVECSEWREIQSHDGKIYRERTCKELPQ